MNEATTNRKLRLFLTGCLFASQFVWLGWILILFNPTLEDYGFFELTYGEVA